MKIKTIQIVLNVEFGGFSLDDEMVLWLAEHKGWTYAEGYDKNEFVDLVGMHGHWVASAKYKNDELRTHPDLIECVKTLQAKYEDLPFSEKHYHHIYNFAIEEIEVHVDVVEYHDGKERIEVRYKEI